LPADGAVNHAGMLRHAYGRRDLAAMRALVSGTPKIVLDELASLALHAIRRATHSEERCFAGAALLLLGEAGARHPDRD
jgi:hypothetical protein